MINILDLIYPPVCGICGKICKEYLCPKCEVKLKAYEINYKRNFKETEKYYDEIYCLLEYKDLVRESILKYKFQNKSYLYKTFSKIILKNKKICGLLKKYDIIIPVPINKKRKQERGYNQTELIANEIKKNTNLELEKNVLIKHKNIISQSELNKYDRKQNIKNAFMVKDNTKILNQKILLFDDIYTTGSTVNECSKVLKQAGAKKIGILTLAKD